MTETQLKRYADVIVWGIKKARLKGFKKGDLVSVRFDMAAVRLAELVQERLIREGMNPTVRMLPTPVMEINALKLGSAEQIVYQMPGTREMYEALNGSVYIHAPESLTHLKQVDPEKISMSIKSRKYLKDILDGRDQKGLFGWTLCTYPTQELARQAKMSVGEYTRQVVKACFLDEANPVKKWEEVFKKAGKIKTWLSKLPVKYFHVESKGTDLKVTPGEKRQWLGVSGHNVPSFELFTSPDWRGTEGVYFADQPSFRLGNYVKGVRLEFKRGQVTGAKAKEGEKFLKQQLATDAGARRIGEFSLTDIRFSRIDRFMADTLYDENFGGKFGNCHLAVGSSYADTYAGNVAKLDKKMKEKLGYNDSAVHWDLVNTQDKTVTAHLIGGGKVVVYGKGRFTCC